MTVLVLSEPIRAAIGCFGTLLLLGEHVPRSVQAPTDVVPKMRQFSITIACSSSAGEKCRSKVMDMRGNQMAA